MPSDEMSREPQPARLDPGGSDHDAAWRREDHPEREPTHGRHRHLEHEPPQGPRDQPGRPRGEHGHPHGQDERHEHEHPRGLRGILTDLLVPHRHGTDRVDAVLESSEQGIRALQVSLVALGLTAALQLVVVAISGSVALLADTVHNFADALTAVPLWIAFALGRRAANRRYPYGYGRAEDLAGVVVVLFIFASALLVLWESFQKLKAPVPMEHPGFVAVAALIGFLGNEAVALYRIRVGRRIGSAALVADGYHARADGLTSLSVLLGVGGTVLGFPIADPLVGLGIAVVILLVTKDAALAIWHRVMDAVEPEVIAEIERAARQVPGVVDVGQVRARWLGHRLEADLHVVVDEDLPLARAHAVAEEVRHALFHANRRLTTIVVHVDPCGHSGRDHHDLTADHEQRGRPAGSPSAPAGAWGALAPEAATRESAAQRPQSDAPS